MNSDSKRQYRFMLETVKKVLIAVDPCKFEPGKPDGTPLDEYDAEIVQIVKFVFHGSNN